MIPLKGDGGCAPTADSSGREQLPSLAGAATVGCDAELCPRQIPMSQALLSQPSPVISLTPRRFAHLHFPGWFLHCQDRRDELPPQHDHCDHSFMEDPGNCLSPANAITTQIKLQSKGAQRQSPRRSLGAQGIAVKQCIPCLLLSDG